MRIAFAVIPTAERQPCTMRSQAEMNRVGNWAGVTVERKESLIRKAIMTEAKSSWR